MRALVFWLAFVSAPPAAAPVPAPAPAPRPVDQVEQQTRAQVEACRRACSTDASLSETDRATCKLSSRPSGPEWQCNVPVQAEKVRREGTATKTSTTVHPRAVDPAPGTAKPVAPSGAPAERTLDNFSLGACFSSCEHERGSSGTTCRLNCEATARRMAMRANTLPSAAASTGSSLVEPGPRPLVVHRTATTTAAAPAPAGEAVAACQRACASKPGLTETDRATCRLGCRPSNVGVERVTVEGTPFQVRCFSHCECAAECRREAASCRAACPTDGSTNAATCIANCGQVESGCARNCGPKEAFCTCSR